jgi:hypothetical protein
MPDDASHGNLAFPAAISAFAMSLGKFQEVESEVDVVPTMIGITHIHILKDRVNLRRRKDSTWPVVICMCCTPTDQFPGLLLYLSCALPKIILNILRRCASSLVYPLTQLIRGSVDRKTSDMSKMPGKSFGCFNSSSFLLDSQSP